MFSATIERIETRGGDVTGIGKGTTVAGRAYGPERPEAMKRTIDVSVLRATG